MEVGRLVANHVAEHGLGVTCGAETGFLLSRNPDTVLAPDVAFVCRGRASSAATTAWFEGAPDLAVEVASPGDSYSELHGKAVDWIRFGCRLVWVLEPKAQRVTVYGRDGSSRILSMDQDLTGDDVLPDFVVPVRELFPAPPA